MIKLLLLSLLLLVQVTSTEEIIQQYVYLTWSDDLVTLHKINPVEERTTTTEIHGLEGILTEAKLSPSGEWISLVYARDQAYHVHIYNIETGEIRVVHEDIILSFPDNVVIPLGLMENADYVQWSASSDHLAFAVIEDQSSRIYAYTLASETIQPIETQFAGQYLFRWAATADRLAVVTWECDESSWECSESLEITQLGPSPRITTVSIADLSTIAGVGASQACRVRWSPDDRWLAFMANCDASYVGTVREVFLLDTLSHTIIPITDFTEAVRHFDLLPYASSNYLLTWIDNERLLINAAYRLTDVPFTTETYVYNIADERPNLITDFTSRNVSLRPGLTQIAVSPVTYDMEQRQQRGLFMIIDLDDPTNVEQLSEPSCAFEWSANGYLMYTRGSDTNAFSCSINTIVLRDLSTGHDYETAIALPDDTLYLLGWINVQEG